MTILHIGLESSKRKPAKISIKQIIFGVVIQSLNT